MARMTRCTASCCRTLAAAAHTDRACAQSRRREIEWVREDQSVIGQRRINMASKWQHRRHQRK